MGNMKLWRLCFMLKCFLLCSFSESGPPSPNSSVEDFASCGQAETEVRFVYKELSHSPAEDEPKAPPVIAKLPSPICLPEPQPFQSDNSGSGPKSVENWNNGSSGGSLVCVGQERQSVFAFNVSALNPGHIIVNVVTNDSRITKCAFNDE